VSTLLYAMAGRQALVSKAARREAKLCYMGHATMENRHGLAVAGSKCEHCRSEKKSLEHRDVLRSACAR
jgi:hypothetical protein